MEIYQLIQHSFHPGKEPLPYILRTLLVDTLPRSLITNEIVMQKIVSGLMNCSASIDDDHTGVALPYCKSDLDQDVIVLARLCAPIDWPVNDLHKVKVFLILITIIGRRGSIFFGSEQIYKRCNSILKANVVNFFPRGIQKVLRKNDFRDFVKVIKKELKEEEWAEAYSINPMRTFHDAKNTCSYMAYDIHMLTEHIFQKYGNDAELSSLVHRIREKSEYLVDLWNRFRI